MAKKGLASIGIKITIGDYVMKNHSNIGALGGAPSLIDVTNLTCTSNIGIPGVKETDAWEVDYFYDNSDTDSDFRNLKNIELAGEVVDVTVEFPDGTIHGNTAYVSTWTDGVGTNAAIPGKLSCALQEAWATIHPDATE